MAEFNIQAPFEPTGDQPSAIASLVKSIEAGTQYQTLRGATGTGKTHTIALNSEALCCDLRCLSSSCG